eukprot:6189866-Pleurochrysis_carterae.AAC.1
MGASASLDSTPLELSELLNFRPTGALPPLRYRSNIKVWRFYVHEGPLDVRSAPVSAKLLGDPNAIAHFSAKECYVLLHIYCRRERAGSYSGGRTEEARNSPAVPTGTRTGVPTASNGNLSLVKVAEASGQLFTPRGVSAPFSGYEDCGPYPFEVGEASHHRGYDADRIDEPPLGHDIYIWNGCEALALTKAVALTKCFELERYLIHDTVGAVRHLHRGAGVDLIPAEDLFDLDLPPNSEAVRAAIASFACVKLRAWTHQAYGLHPNW